MASSSVTKIDLTLEPDLQPLYPTPSQLSQLLSPHVGLSPKQKADLVTHCVTRACVFGDFTLLSYLLADPQAQPYIDLGRQDEDGLGVISATILGFGSESERDVEREECVRLLIAEGADVNLPDNAGWISLHHAALLAPPTLVSHLLTHGCSPFAATRRRLTALDIVTAHSTIPGREDVRLLLEEAMREKGWTGGRMEERRRALEKQNNSSEKRKALQDHLSKVLEIGHQYWGDPESDSWASSDDIGVDDTDDVDAMEIFTPTPDYTSMLVFSPNALPNIFQSLIVDFRPILRNSEPANVLYMLARFACLNCDDLWLEDLVIGATDAIEDTFFNRGEDLGCLVFWLYNISVWLHLMRCDEALKETCEMLGSYTLIEEILNSVFVFIIRFAERRIDQLLDAAILDYSPLPREFETVQFESEWSFLRSFGSAKKKAAPPSPVSKNGLASPSPSAELSRPPTPPTASMTKFASLKNTFGRGRPVSGPLNEPEGPAPKDVTSFMTALQTFFTLSDINPALSTQLWSQVMYWVACEIFNRVLTRKKYLCRSRAVQISLNIGVLEEWIGLMELPRGVGAHFAPVKDLLNWLQCLSSINEFPNLIATVQAMRHMNPLQMRRAVRDYKYEVNEGHMTEECSQYLAQLQKDWERHRLKVGVEALRKDINERDRDRESDSPPMNSSSSFVDSIPPSPGPEDIRAQRNVDMLFEREEKFVWDPPAPPEVLGELLDSRHMLPLYLPTDPRLLGAVPITRQSNEERRSTDSPNQNGADLADGRAGRHSRGSIMWRLPSRRLREVEIRTLQWIDGAPSTARWYRPMNVEDDEDDAEDDQEAPPPYSGEDSPDDGPPAELRVVTHFTPLTRSRSTARSKGRLSSVGTPAESPHTLTSSIPH